MRVLHINTNDQGGAATAITRIHLGLLKKTNIRHGNVKRCNSAKEIKTYS